MSEIKRRLDEHLSQHEPESLPEKTELDRFTKAIERLQTVEGCPELPEWCLPYYEGGETYDAIACSKYESYAYNPPAVLAALRDWVIGKVVPWVEDHFGRSVDFRRVRTPDGRKAYRVCVDYFMATEIRFALAVLALLEAIVEVVVQEGGA